MRGITQGARGITLGAFVPVKKTKSCPDQNVLDLIKIQTENISLHEEIEMGDMRHFYRPLQLPGAIHKTSQVLL